MAKPVIIFGCGDFARIAAIYLEFDGDREVIGFTVHQAFLKEPTLLGKPIIPFESLLIEYPPDRVDLCVAVGFRGVNRERAKVYELCKCLGYQFVTYVSPKAQRLPQVTIGENCFIFENNVLQPFVSIGNNTILWSGNHIGHDSTVGNHCFIASHVVISGNCKIGDYSFLGVNATLRDGISLGESCVVGAGCLVLQNAEAKSVFKGVGSEISKVPSDRIRM